MFTLDRIVPWGRSFGEYLRMFALSDTDLRLKMLGCADGSASFNAEATRRGVQVISADPLYGLEADKIRDRITATYSQILQQTRLNSHQFIWDTIPSVDELGRMRMEAIQAFLEDYDRGRQQGRYIEAELLLLPFADKSFVWLCARIFSSFTRSTGPLPSIAEQFSNCAGLPAESGFFPLLALDGRPSPHVACITNKLGDSCEVFIEVVPYEFQRGGNQTMRVRELETKGG